MSVVIVTGVVLCMMLLSGIAGYIGWYLSHASYGEGFNLGYNHGRQEMYEQMKPTPPPTLRPVK